jgi:superfamily II DNA or RNA helicase
MATGSGKTLVIIKIIEFLRRLMKRGEIPEYDILFLTYREDLIKQFKNHLEEYNEGRNEKILVEDLKDYEKLKRGNLFKGINVFYYKSDLFSDEEKEKIVDFRNYYNDGKWFVILDEAHKGDTEESKRQHIFSILSKNGFLFNFSATFSDEIDLVTTCFEYNLSTFIEEGYGKKIYISDYEVKAFREEFRQRDKQKIILKGLILLAYIKKELNKIKGKIPTAYHNPLLLVLVNSVNEEDADLKLFFEEIENIAKNKFDRNLINEAKEELRKEFQEKEKYDMPENDEIKIDYDLLSKIDYEDILKEIFNSQESGTIEISYSPKEKGEVAFKLKTSDNHFALMKTGNMPDWLKKSLSQFDVNHTFEEEKFFERINKDDSPINILLGSRVFYEGWDSNRPNIIMFINIGTRENAKKFVLQSIGRGVRIEPIKNERKRLLFIKDKVGDVFDEIKNYIFSIESLFVFGTNKKAIETIIKEVGEIREKSTKCQKTSLFKNEEKIRKGILLVPKYKEGGKRVFEEDFRFNVHLNDFEKLKAFNEFVKDDRILLVLCEAEPILIKHFRNSFNNVNNFYKFSDIEKRDIDLILRNLFSFWGGKFKEFEKFEELKDEIKHFENIVIEEAKFKDFESIKDAVLKTKGSLPFESLRLEYISNHYYLPIVLSKDEKVDYIKHIIKTKSEVEFIEKLENYLNNPNNKFNEFDWWMFSKIDESLDEVYIPYYNLDRNLLSKFKPDFIFWLKKGNEYFIVFVDPKSTKFTDYENKISWYKKLFEEENKPKGFKYNGLNCYVYCFLYTDDKDKVRYFGYEKYWFEDFDNILKVVLSK